MSDRTRRYILLGAALITLMLLAWLVIAYLHPSEDDVTPEFQEKLIYIAN